MTAAIFVMTVKIIECPRDAMQGFDNWIPTELKIRYINSLLDCGFDVLDFGSFVSEKAIPQLKDTKEVLNKIQNKGKTKLLAIIANYRGAEEACEYEKIDYLGYPFSVSGTFQRRNTNKGREDSFEILNKINQLAIKSGKETVAYISMGFGNPYGDEWSLEIVEEWTSKVIGLGINQISLSDTVGQANDSDIKALFSYLMPRFPKVEFGAHLHTRFDNWKQNVKAAYDAGCRRFDSTIKGFGGCPFAEDELTGNLPTENLIQFLDEIGENHKVNKVNFSKSFELSMKVFK